MDRTEVLVLQKPTVPRAFWLWYRMISRALRVGENIPYPGEIGASVAGLPDLLRGHISGRRSGNLARAEVVHLLEASEQPRASLDGFQEAMPMPDHDRSLTPLRS